MALAQWPDVAKIREWRLRIVHLDDNPMSEMTLRAPYAARYSEMWTGELLVRALRHSDARAVAAWLAERDGRTTQFRLPLPAGVVGQAASWTAFLNSAPALGADTVELALSPATGLIKAGTLFTVGDIEGTAFQLFEVLEDTAAAAMVEVPVAPRVGYEFNPLYDAVSIGSVDGRFTLAVDQVDAEMMLSHGMVTVPVLEGL